MGLWGLPVPGPGDARALVQRTGGVVDGADGLLDSGGQLVQRSSETTSEEELQALVHDHRADEEPPSAPRSPTP